MNKLKNFYNVYKPEYLFYTSIYNRFNRIILLKILYNIDQKMNRKMNRKMNQKIN